MPIRYLSGINVDSNTLFVDAVNDRVGIGTGGPTKKLDVTGDGLFSSSGNGDTLTIAHSSGSGIAIKITKGGNGEGLYVDKTSGTGNAVTIIGTLNATTLVKSGGTSSQYLMADGSVSTLTNPVTGTGTTNFVPKWTSASAIGDSQIFDNGTNVGIGTSSVSGTYEKLAVAGGISIKDNTNAKLEIGRFNSTGAQNSYIKLGANSNSLRFTNNTDVADLMELTNSGNLGLGVTPSAWGAAFRVFQIGSGRTALYEESSIATRLVNNVFFSDANRYFANGEASAYTQQFGTHIWAVAPNGTAGNPVTLTSAMTLTNAGALLVGTTSTTNTASGKIVNLVAGSSTLDLALNGGGWSIGSIGAEPALCLSSNIIAATGVAGSTQSAKGGMGFEFVSPAAPTDLILGIFGAPTVASSVRIFNNSERLRITSGGNVLVGTTTDAGFKLQVNGTSAVMGGNQLRLYRTDNATYGSIQYLTGAGGFKFDDVNGDGYTFAQGANVRLSIGTTGAIRFNAYGAGTITGTPAFNLAVDSSGNIIETAGGVVDGSGTANFVTKWQDANTVTNSSITDDGTTVIALVNRVAMNQQAGIYVFPKNVGASASAGVFEIKNTHGAQALRVAFVCNTSSYSVAKTFEVVHCFALTPVFSKVVDTGPFDTHDFNVVFTNNGDNTGLIATIVNISTTLTANIVATVFLGGSSTTITITAL